LRDGGQGRRQDGGSRRDAEAVACHENPCLGSITSFANKVCMLSAEDHGSLRAASEGRF
jgi:hypothetical protein